MIIAKLENKNIRELTINSENPLGEEIQYDVTYFRELKNLETIALNGFEVNNDLIEKLNCLKNLKDIILNHCKFSNTEKLTNNIENVIITYCDITKLNIFEQVDNVKTIELIGIDDVDLNDLTEMKNLVEILIYNSKIKNSNKIKDFLHLKTLKLDVSLVDVPNFRNFLNDDVSFSYKEKFYIEV